MRTCQAALIFREQTRAVLGRYEGSAGKHRSVNAKTTW